MRAWLLCLGVMLAAPAFADEPELVIADKVHVKLDTHSKRFVGTEIKGPRFTPVVELTVLYIEGDQVRVWGNDNTHGWLPMDALEKRAPGMDVDPEELQKLLEQMNLQGG